MPKRLDIQSILVIGSGPIVIGQACEFDYSGNQALRALKEESYRTILVNSNPATIMTDKETADKVYIEPLTVDFLSKVIEKERPDAILPTMGGQTALNITVELEEKGVLEKYGVEILGANVEVIKRAENREIFRNIMLDIGLEVPKSKIVKNMEEGKKALKEISFPLILRPSFTLGGEGGGIINSLDEYQELLQNGLKLSPISEVLVEESLIHWKEYELEVVRDKKDNVIIVCSIENMDPMGIHTGDSITVAPSQTLSDGEYQRLRDMAIKVVRAIGVDTGGANVQFAVHPKTGRVIVIEINPRVSRSSALASKATGFPIAKVAARLALGYTLDEIPNDITKVTQAGFEPSLDYVVVKVPRFDFEKFRKAQPYLNTTMKSIGEVMSIGATFKEAFLKALSSMETERLCLTPTKFDKESFTEEKRQELLDFLSRPHHKRMFYLATAIRQNIPIETIYKITGIDPWFLDQLKEIITMEKEIQKIEDPVSFFSEAPSVLAKIKSFGFSDAYIASLLKDTKEKTIQDLRHKWNVRPSFRAVDTCAAEFKAFTPYLYSTYANWNSSSLEKEITAAPGQQDKTVIILGSGPNRIGQGIEFDYCCVHSSLALQEQGYRVVLINCNPETISTDNNISNRLYFEPITIESILEIAYMEKPKGLVLQFGGQTPLKLAKDLQSAGLEILGTSVDAIDQAEDRKRCEELAANFGLKTPESGIAHSMDSALEIAKKIGYPLLVRPNYVLGGRAMRVVPSEDSLAIFLKEALQINEGRSVFLDRFLQDATEVDVDVLCDGETAVIGGVMEHIEKAGIHSGDSSCAIPPFSLSPQIKEQICQAVRELAFTFKVKGLMNVQLAVQDDDIYLIEVNPRASRTVPFVSKAIGVPLAKIASKIIGGEKLSSFSFPKALDDNLSLYYVKGPIFPFQRFDKTDTILGPEMLSTGEVMGKSHEFGSAFAKSLIAAGISIPRSGTVFLSIRDDDKTAILNIARELVKSSFSLEATTGTHAFLKEHHIPSQFVRKLAEGRDNCVDRIRDGKYSLVINTTSNEQAIKDSYSIRRTALETHTPCLTNIASAIALLKAIDSPEESLGVQPL